MAIVPVMTLFELEDKKEPVVRLTTAALELELSISSNDFIVTYVDGKAKIELVRRLTTQEALDLAGSLVKGVDDIAETEEGSEDVDEEA